MLKTVLGTVMAGAIALVAGAASASPAPIVNMKLILDNLDNFVGATLTPPFNTPFSGEFNFLVDLDTPVGDVNTGTGGQAVSSGSMEIFWTDNSDPRTATYDTSNTVVYVQPNFSSDGADPASRLVIDGVANVSAGGAGPNFGDFFRTQLVINANTFEIVEASPFNFFVVVSGYDQFSNFPYQALGGEITFQTEIPVPAALPLLATGIGGLALAVRRRRIKSAA